MDRPKDSSVFLSVLLEGIGIYVETALEGCLDFAATAELAKNEPDLSYFTELNSASIILSLMYTTINTALIPLSLSSLTLRREMMLMTNRYLSKTEERIDLIISKTIDVIINHVTNVLLKQSKRDLRSRDDDVQLTNIQTPVSVTTDALS